MPNIACDDASTHGKFIILSLKVIHRLRYIENKQKIEQINVMIPIIISTFTSQNCWVI